MPLIRNQLSSVAAGGRRQFSELRDKFLIVADEDRQLEVSKELRNINLNTTDLDTAGVIVAEPQDRLDSVLEDLSDQITQAQQAASDIRDEMEEEEGIVETTVATAQATQELLSELDAIENVLQADFAMTFADYGPENLRMTPFEMPTVSNTQDKEGTLEDVLRDEGIRNAWDITRGENAAVAIFDTGYAQDLISQSRIAGTYHADEVDSVWASQEGHGTMCAGAAAANADEGVPFNGVAPDADVYLVRTTGQDGQIRSDVIAQAWDWIVKQSANQPIVANHSYGTPICSSPQLGKSCNDTLGRVIAEATADPNLTAVYAAGNEAMYCGHRLSGITNGITGHNSMENVVTVGALLTSGRDAQRYSSHGRGDCAPRADPKPNVSFRLPKFTYYGGEDGYKIKDMSTGIFGSGGGTSHASPTTCGAIALLQSQAVEARGGPLETEEIKTIIRNNSEPPRTTQVNQFGFVAGPAGWDARFGFGQFKVEQALRSL